MMQAHSDAGYAAQYGTALQTRNGTFNEKKTREKSTESSYQLTEKCMMDDDAPARTRSAGRALNWLMWQLTLFSPRTQTILASSTLPAFVGGACIFCVYFFLFHIFEQI